MSDNTPRLALPALAAGQAQMSVTHNEALVQLDAFGDVFLLGQFVDTPPSSPADGDTYLTGGAPTGAWSGYAYKLAYCIDGGWRFYTPFNGLRAYAADSGSLIQYQDGDWNMLAGAGETSFASAATCDLGAAASLFVQITGTTTITSFGTAANTLRWLRFAQALTLTHDAAHLILLGGAARVTAAGDVGLYVSDASGNWRERIYLRAASDPGDYATKSGSETLSNKTLVTPALGVATGTSLALGGATLGSDALGVSGSASVSTTLNAGAVNVNSTTIPTNGIYMPAPTTLGIATNGIERFTINAGGGMDSINAAGGRFSILNSSATQPVFIPNKGSLLTGLGAQASGNLSLICAGTEMARVAASAITLNATTAPGTDNSFNLGSASFRFATVFAGTGAINTSDEDSKVNVRALDAAESAVALALASGVRFFQFRDAVAAKGHDARLHAGMLAQEVAAAFAAQGLDASRYGLFCRDALMQTGPDGGLEPALDENGAPKHVLGLRYDELAQFVMAGLAARIAILEVRGP